MSNIDNDPSFLCRLHGLGTLYGLDNAGTVYDGGGNVSNNKTGSGTISVPAL